MIFKKSNYFLKSVNVRLLDTYLLIGVPNISPSDFRPPISMLVVLPITD